MVVDRAFIGDDARDKYSDVVQVDISTVEHGLTIMTLAVLTAV